MPVRGHRCTFMAVCVTFLIPLSYLLSPLANSFFFSPTLRLRRCARQRKSRSLIFTDPHWRRVSKPRATLMLQPAYTNSYPASQGVFGCVPIPGASSGAVAPDTNPPTRHATVTLGCGNLQGFNVQRHSPRLSPKKKKERKTLGRHL